jgi:hypothetical protein
LSCLRYMVTAPVGCSMAAVASDRAITCRPRNSQIGGRFSRRGKRSCGPGLFAATIASKNRRVLSHNQIDVCVRGIFDNRYRNLDVRLGSGHL